MSADGTASSVVGGIFFGLPLLTSMALRWYGQYNKNTANNNRTGGSRYRVIEDKTPSGTLVYADINENTPTEQWNTLGLERPLVIAMVGLPARGKSYLVKMIQRYLNWTGYECEVFNVGKYRREMGLAGVDSTFFSSSNADAVKSREELAMRVQDSMYEWLSRKSKPNKNAIGSSHVLLHNKRVAIFDATNTTRSRRHKLMQRARREGSALLFVESICNDEEVLRRNYLLKLKNDDYNDMDPERALADFMNRVAAYERVYETIEDEENGGSISYIKLINVGQKVITRNCSGYLPSQVAFHLQNVHIQPRKIYLTLTAESFTTVGNMLTVSGANMSSGVINSEAAAVVGVDGRRGSGGAAGSGGSDKNSSGAGVGASAGSGTGTGSSARSHRQRSQSAQNRPQVRSSMPQKDAEDALAQDMKQGRTDSGADVGMSLDDSSDERSKAAPATSAAPTTPTGREKTVIGRRIRSSSANNEGSTSPSSSNPRQLSAVKGDGARGSSSAKPHSAGASHRTTSRSDAEKGSFFSAQNSGNNSDAEDGDDNSRIRSNSMPPLPSADGGRDQGNNSNGSVDADGDSAGHAGEGEGEGYGSDYEGCDGGCANDDNTTGAAANNLQHEYSADETHEEIGFELDLDALARDEDAENSRRLTYGRGKTYRDWDRSLRATSRQVDAVMDGASGSSSLSVEAVASVAEMDYGVMSARHRRTGSGSSKTGTGYAYSDTNKSDNESESGTMTPNRAVSTTASGLYGNGGGGVVNLNGAGKLGGSSVTTRGYQYVIDLTRYIKQEQDLFAIALEREKSKSSSRNNGTDASDTAESDSDGERAYGRRHGRNRTLSGSMGSGREALILAGTSSVHLETISHLRVHYPIYNTPLLEELRAGNFHGLSTSVIKKLYPNEYRKRCENKLTYRYPGVGGESYLDVIERVKPIIIELERQRNSVVVVCHLAVLRCIHAYFMGTPVAELPYMNFKKHTVYVLSPGPMGCTCKAVDPSTET